MEGKSRNDAPHLHTTVSYAYRTVLVVILSGIIKNFAFLTECRIRVPKPGSENQAICLCRGVNSIVNCKKEISKEELFIFFVGAPIKCFNIIQ